jgi:hypothetical protein
MYLAAGALTDLDAVFTARVLIPWCTPGRILADHLPGQITNFAGVPQPANRTEGHRNSLGSRRAGFAMTFNIGATPDRVRPKLADRPDSDALRMLAAQDAEVLAKRKSPEF